jgi:TonB family protein
MANIPLGVPKNESPRYLIHNFCRLAVATLLAIFLLGGVLLIGQEPERKVLKKVAPQYPKILRERGIGGTVRLKVAIEPDGEVSSVEILGGNAILAEQAAAAVKQWRYAPSSKATITEVRINFDPRWQ